MRPARAELVEVVELVEVAELVEVVGPVELVEVAGRLEHLADVGGGRVFVTSFHSRILHGLAKRGLLGRLTCIYTLYYITYSICIL